MSKRVNVLGDIRGENDKEMLEAAFYETPDYRTLIESSERPIIVGRRGTGKSALCYELCKYWRRDPKTIVSQIIPQEDQIIGLRPLLTLYGDKYTQVKAGSRIVWKYAMLMEIALKLFDRQRNARLDANSLTFQQVQDWRRLGNCITSRTRLLVKNKSRLMDSPQSAIANLAQDLRIAEIHNELTGLVADSNWACLEKTDSKSGCI